MKPFLAALALGVLSLPATSVRADLLGTQVSGTLNFGTSTVNYFDPANGYVPKRFKNYAGADHVTIGKGIEFGYRDGVNRDTANFTAYRLTIRDKCLDGTDCDGNAPFTMTFTDPAFYTIALVKDSLGSTYGLDGDVLTIDFDGGRVKHGNAVAVFRFGDVAPTPEPGTMALMSTGLLAGIGAIRRRLFA